MKIFNAKKGIFDPKRAETLRRLDEQQRDREREDRAAKLRRECGTFLKYQDADIDDVDFVRRYAPDAVAAYSDVALQMQSLLNMPGMLILRGDNGPGKTHLASGLVHYFCNQGSEAFYCRAIDFFTKVKSCFGAPGKTMEDLEQRFRTYKLLVIDEIETRSDSQWENNLLRSLIDARYASMVSTVLITNKSADEINTYFSPAIRDRIRESGGIVHCDWQSLRGVTA